MLKKMLFVLLSLLLLCSCGNKEVAEEKDLLAQIKEQGYIEVATEPYWAPNEFIDPSNNTIVGMDIELAQYIADKIGVELKVVPLEFSAVLTSITESKYDMAISAIAWSPEREEAMALSEGYEINESYGYGFLARVEDVDKYTTIESLEDAVVITQSASVQEAILNKYVPKTKETKLVSSMTDAYLALSEGKADVVITGEASGTLYAEANGNKLAMTGFIFDVDRRMLSTCVALPKKDSESLMEIVNQCIAELTQQGKFNEWSQYYNDYARSLRVIED